jgi:predicted RecB family endonuclease
MTDSGALERKIRDWLDSTGFPLEMEVAELFREQGFAVRQSSTWVDRATEKVREIDVVAKQESETGGVEVAFVVECKASKHPWVVLCSDHTLSGYNRIFALSLTSRGARTATATRVLAATSPMRNFVLVPDRSGYALREALSAKDSDAAFAAAMSATKAAAAQVRHREPGGIEPISFAFPVVVVDSPLFEAAYVDVSGLQLEQVARSAFLFDPGLSDHAPVLVHIVARDHVSNFATWAKQVASAIHADLGEREQ